MSGKALKILLANNLLVRGQCKGASLLSSAALASFLGTSRGEGLLVGNTAYGGEVKKCGRRHMQLWGRKSMKEEENAPGARGHCLVLWCSHSSPFFSTVFKLSKCPGGSKANGITSASVQFRTWLNQCLVKKGPGPFRACYPAHWQKGRQLLQPATPAVFVLSGHEFKKDVPEFTLSYWNQGAWGIL